jgi:hypothetical protein
MAIVFVGVGAIGVLAVQSLRYADNKEKARGASDFAILIWPTLRFSFGPPWKTKTA